ncbi:MAG: hypothetical protein KDB11_34665, partial [Planctomycetales bacterium]|nr:hypothetical protein [Planctomycetales bacterium]
WLETVQNGTIELGALTSVRGVYIPIDGTGTLAAVGGASATATITSLQHSRIEASNVAVDLSNVTNAFSTDFIINNVTVDLSHLASANQASFNVTGADQDLSSLGSVTDGSFAINGSNVDLSNLADIDGTDFYIGGSVPVTLPSVTSVTNTSGDGVWQVTGSNTVLSFPNLTTVSNGTSANQDFYIQALQGGR